MNDAVYGVSEVRQSQIKSVVQIGLDGVYTVGYGDFVDVEFGVVSALLTFGKVYLKVPATVGVEGSVMTVDVNLFETRHILYLMVRKLFYKF